MQKGLDHLVVYYTKNENKCKCLTFTRKVKPITYNYHFNGEQISRAQTMILAYIWIAYCRDTQRLFWQNRYFYNHKKIYNKVSRTFGARLPYLLHNSDDFMCVLFYFLCHCIVYNLLRDTIICYKFSK